MTQSTSIRSTSEIALADRYVSITGSGRESRFHYVWLRDNCWCDECRVEQSGERRLFTASIPMDIAPTTAPVGRR